MKIKRIAPVGLLLLLAVIISMSGCADFAFHPIGRWEYINEQRVYVDGKLVDTEKEEGFFSGFSVTLVFQKSGTGYVDSGIKEKQRFNYEFDDKQITITYEDTKRYPEPITYNVIDNGKELTVVADEYDYQESNGKMAHCRIESVFRKVS